MSEPCAVEITFVIDEDLGLIHEATKCSGMNDAIAVALKLTTIGRRILHVTAASGVGWGDGIRGEVCGHDTLGSG